MQIKDLPSSTSLASTDVLVKETSAGTTQKIAAENVINTSDTGYCKMPDGTLIQWGR